MTDIKKNLEKLVDGILKNDSDMYKSAFNEYIIPKCKEVREILEKKVTTSKVEDSDKSDENSDNDKHLSNRNKKKPQLKKMKKDIDKIKESVDNLVLPEESEELNDDSQLVKEMLMAFNFADCLKFIKLSGLPISIPPKDPNVVKKLKQSIFNMFKQGKISAEDIATFTHKHSTY